MRSCLFPLNDGSIGGSSGTDFIELQSVGGGGGAAAAEGRSGMHATGAYLSLSLCASERRGGATCSVTGIWLGWLSGPPVLPSHLPPPPCVYVDKM